MVVAVLVAAWLLATPLTSTEPAESGRRRARFEGAEPGRRGGAALAEGGAQPRLKALLDTSGLPDVLRPVRPHPDRQRRRSGRRAGQRSRRRGRAAERGQDPRRGAGMPKGVGGHRFRGRTQPGDVQRARRRGLGDRHASRPTARPTTRRWCPTTPMPTSRSSTCRACRRRRCRSREEPAKTGTDALVLGYPGGGDFQATPARVRETIELNGPDIYKRRPSTARCTRSEALCGKVIRVAR